MGGLETEVGEVEFRMGFQSGSAFPWAQVASDTHRKGATEESIDTAKEQEKKKVWSKKWKGRCASRYLSKFNNNLVTVVFYLINTTYIFGESVYFINDVITLHTAQGLAHGRK